jgi:hypothetical protein
MFGIARTMLSLLAVISLTTAVADGATAPRYAASVQDLENRTRTQLRDVMAVAVPDPDIRQTEETPQPTFHIGTPPRTNSRIVTDLTKAFAAYIGLHAIDCLTKSSEPAPPEAVSQNPIANAVWRRLNEMTGGRVSANLGFATQDRMVKNRLVPQRTINAKVTVGLFGPQFSRARDVGQCR